MPDTIYIALLIGALAGTVHAMQVYKSRLIAYQNARQGVLGRHLQALYYSLWTLILWLLLSVCIFWFWMIGVVIFVIYKIFSRPE